MDSVTKVCTRPVTVRLRDGSKLKFYPGRMYTIPEETWRYMKRQNFMDAPRSAVASVSDGEQVDGKQVLPAEEVKRGRGRPPKGE